LVAPPSSRYPEVIASGPAPSPGQGLAVQEDSI
jgi:hypothetical protein